MENTAIILTIVLMALVTVLPRILPVWILSGVKYPKPLVLWLKYVPITVLSALLAPELFLRHSKFDLSFDNLFFWVAIPTFAVAAFTKNFFATIIFGMGILALTRLIFGL